MSLSRRAFLGSMLTSMAGTACSQLPVMDLKTADKTANHDYVLTASPADIRLLEAGSTPAWCFNQNFPAPVIRATQGKPIRILFRNRLPEPTTIHWHGLRIPIGMDGVPFLSQPPIKPGEDFLYEFTPPDAGTFWYHPHVNSVKQLGRGLVGAFIVDEAEPVAFDHEQILFLKNWHIDEAGQFTPFTSPRNAARMGTVGRWETVNGQHKPHYDVPAAGLVRVRILNGDNTLIYRIAIPDYPAWVIAIDGSPIAKPYRLEHHDMGPGMRLDLALVAPPTNQQPIVVKTLKGRLAFDLVTLNSAPSHLNPFPRAIPTLPSNPIPKPDIARADSMHFVFEWAGAISPVNADGSTQHSFWTINRRAWDRMSASYVPAPLATLSLGKSYLFYLKNLSPHSHPIHMHGYTWTVLASNQKSITPFHTDTILLEKNEQVKLAFVADNPGRWMFHCHVIEHMKTGLMGYISVE